MTSNDLLTLEILRLRKELEKYQKDCKECGGSGCGRYKEFMDNDTPCPHCHNGKVAVVRVPDTFMTMMLVDDCRMTEDGKVRFEHTKEDGNWEPVYYTRDPADPEWWVMEEVTE